MWNRQGITQLDIAELQVAGILHKAVVGIDGGGAGGLLDGIAGMGWRPSVSNLSQWVIVISVATVQSAGKCIEELVAIAAADAYEEVPVLISHFGIETIGELGLDIAEYHTVLFVDNAVVVDILELGVTRLNR